MEEENKEDKKEISYLEKVKLEREAMEKTLEENRNILSKLQELKAEQILSGRADQSPNIEKKEETPKEYKNRIMRGEI